jgi:hypothetical protein
VATAQEIQAVAAKMPGVPRWTIEQRIDAGNIDPANYEEEQPS